MRKRSRSRCGGPRRALADTRERGSEGPSAGGRLRLPAVGEAANIKESGRDFLSCIGGSSRVASFGCLSRRGRVTRPPEVQPPSKLARAARMALVCLRTAARARHESSTGTLPCSLRASPRRIRHKHCQGRSGPQPPHLAVPPGLLRFECSTDPTGPGAQAPRSKGTRVAKGTPHANWRSKFPIRFT